MSNFCLCAGIRTQVLFTKQQSLNRITKDITVHTCVFMYVYVLRFVGRFYNLHRFNRRLSGEVRDDQSGTREKMFFSIVAVQTPAWCTGETGQKTTRTAQ